MLCVSIIVITISSIIIFDVIQFTNIKGWMEERVNVINLIIFEKIVADKFSE